MLCYYGDDMEEYRRWEDNIKMDLKEIGVDVMRWVLMRGIALIRLRIGIIGEPL